jgi:hypothetical protein
MLNSLSMSKPPSLKDVATVAEVDPSTASFVINGKGDKLRISPATQARIMAAARQLGYRPNTIARDVALGRGLAPVITSDASGGSATPGKRQIGLVLSAASPVETLALIPSLEPPLSAAGYQLVVVTLPADQAAARERVLRSGFAGLLCCRTVYSAVSALVAGACPAIVLWEGAGKAILNAVSPSPANASVEASGQSAVSSPQPPVQPAPIPPPKPVAIAPVATPKPVIVEPTSSPIPAPVPASVVEQTEITPVTVANPAADTAATTEINTMPDSAEDERAAPVVTGVSPVEANEQNTTPAPVFTPEPEPVPVSAPSPALADPEPVPSPLSPDINAPTPVTPESAPTPVTEAATPEPVLTNPGMTSQEVTPVPVVEPTGITPVTVAVPAADTAATTEDIATPVLTAEESSAPVVTGVSPVEAGDQDTTPVPAPVSEPSPALADPEPVSALLSP